MVDIEADGQVPGDYSMVCFGAIIVEPSLSRTFYGQLKPILDKWDPEALKVSGFSREETLKFDDPKDEPFQTFFEDLRIKETLKLDGECSFVCSDGRTAG